MTHSAGCSSSMGLACTCTPLMATTVDPGRWQPVLPDDEFLRWPLGGRLARDPEREEVVLARTGLGNDSAPIHGLRIYRSPSRLGIIATINITQKFGNLLHCSISHQARDPMWSEIKAMRQVFFPDWVDVMMMLPAAEDYVNVHDHAFHLNQCPERWGLR